MFSRYNFVDETRIIDALRGLAALLVLVSHADSNYLIRYDPFLPYKGCVGLVGVYLFFILSGYLIWTSAGRQLPRIGGLRAYLVHRATRIMPLYYVALAFGIFVFPLLSSYPVELNANSILRNATFTQSLLPSESRAINPVLWTLTHEMLFYLLVPLMFLGRQTFPLILALVALGTWHGYTHADGTFSPFLQLIFLFAVGMTLAQYKLCPTRLMAETATLTAILLGLAEFSLTWICLAWAIALLSAALSLREYRGTAPVRLFAFVGSCSYSLYIWHYMLIEIVGPWLMKLDYFPVHHPVVTAIGFTTFCIAFSWASYRLIEVPGQTVLRRAMLSHLRAGPSAA